MRKVFSYIIFSFLLLIICLSFYKVNASSNTIFNIITTPGENMDSEVTISYHSMLNDTYVLYKLKSEESFDENNKTYPIVETFKIDEKFVVNNKEGKTSNIFERFKCKVSLNNLEKGKEYQYQIFSNSGEKSEIYNFKTANDESFSFIHMTDPQFYTQSGADVFNDLMGIGYSKKDIAFTMMSGDISDKGGSNSYWEMFFNEPNLKLGTIATVPGNHEYYDVSQTPITMDASFYNGFIQNVSNGSVNSPNSSYFFKYNNCLFIMVDSENQAQGKSQVEWFKEVVENNPSEFIIVAMHRSFYGSVYASDSVALRSTWQSVFDKYGVDLVLTGHDHVYTRSYPVYKGEKSSGLLGTTYVTGGSAGDKMSYSVTPNDFYAFSVDLSKTKLSTFSIVTVENGKISVEALNENSEIIDSYQILSKRSQSENGEKITKNEFLDSISLTHRGDITNCFISFSNKAFEIVKKVEVINKINGAVISDTFVYSSLIDGIEAYFPRDKINELTFVVTFKDGEKEEIDYTYSTIMPWGEIKNVRYENYDEENCRVDIVWDNMVNEQVKSFRIYQGNSFIGEVDSAESKYTIEGFLKEESNYTLQVYSINRKVIYQETISYDEESKPINISLSKSDITLHEGEIDTVNIISNSNEEINAIWISSDNSIASVNNGTIIAHKEGTCKITVNILDKTFEINVLVEAKENEVSKGCNKVNLCLLLTFSFSLLITIFRRKHK